MSSPSTPLSAGQAAASSPLLARLLEPLPPQTPLTMQGLTQAMAGGRPLDRLSLCIIMLDYLRVHPA